LLLEMTRKKLHKFQNLSGSAMRAYEVLGQPPAQYFVGTFGDTRASNLAVPPFEWQLLHQPQSTVNLDRAIHHPACHFRAHDFDHVREIAHVVAAILAPSAFVDH